MTFAQTDLTMLALYGGDEWKVECDLLNWCLCDQCGREFPGGGSETQEGAILRAKVDGWLEWTRFSSCEGLDPALGKELFCPRCSLEFKT